MPTIDVHQHLWPEELIDALGRRERPPRLRGTVLELAGEGEWEVDLGAHRLETRLDLLDRHGIDVAVVSLSPTLGFDELPAEESAELTTAFERGIVELARSAEARIVPLAAGAPREGFAGVCIGAGRLADLESLAPLLDDVAAAGSFVFVHPGPAGPWNGKPSWWPAVVDYTAQMQAAYAAWLAEGAVRWPELRIVLALLAGGGPFQVERLGTRGGIAGRDLLHENVLFETSSYGRRALELSLSTYGVGQLLFGTDAPVLDPELGLDAVRSFGDAVAEALCVTNPTRLLA